MRCAAALVACIVVGIGIGIVGMARGALREEMRDGVHPPPSTIEVSGGQFVTGADRQTVDAFTIINNDGAAQLITSFASPACASLRLEQWDGSAPNNGPLELTVPGKDRMVFLRGGFNLHCEHPPRPLQIGDKVPVSTTFRKLPPFQAAFDARAPTPGGMVEQRAKAGGGL